jgi:predicted nicotinamide N-methyase
MARAGSHVILAQLIHYDSKQATSIMGSSIQMSEQDTDAIFEIKDVSGSVAQVPVFLRPLSFPKQCPFTKTELQDRLPIAFQLSKTWNPSNTWSFHLTWMKNNSSSDYNADNILWIQHITDRQSEQYDVGFGRLLYTFHHLGTHDNSHQLLSLHEVTWPSSVALSHWLFNHSDGLHNGTILEIGAGTGLVGLVAAKILYESAWNPNTMEKGRVILTDYNPLVVDNLHRNILLNGLETYAKAEWFDFYHHDTTNDNGGWEQPLLTDTDTLQSCTLDAVDLILAADVICQASDSVNLSKTIFDRLKPGGRAMVSLASTAHRFGVEIFQSECEKWGLRVQITTVMPEGNPDAYLATSGYVDGMEINLYEITKE